MPITPPDFGQLVTYKTVDGVFQVALSQHALDVPETLAAVQADYALEETFGRTWVLAPSTLAALRADLATGYYHQDVIDHEIVGDDPAQIITNLIAVRSRPEWCPGITVTAGDVYLHNGNLYTVIQGHTTQVDWPPDTTPALWRRFYELEAGPQPWVQPQGAHDAYQKGDRVTHNGATWESDIDANVWEPGVYGWEQVL